MKAKKIAIPVTLKDDKQGQITVTIPAISEEVVGSSVPEALLMAEQSIEKYIIEHDVPQNITDPDVSDDSVTSLIAIDVEPLLAKREKLSVKRSVTIPRYLVEAGREAHLNFSKVLTDALKDILEKD